MTTVGAIGSIYVQVKGDTTQFEKDMSSLRTFAKKSGTEVSKALNNAVTPRTASKGIEDLSMGLSRLAQSAKSSSQGFTQSAQQIASGLSGVAKQAGITEAQYASMVEKMLRNRALTTATTSLKTLSNAMGLTARESKALAIQMGYSSTQADKMAGSVKKMQGNMSGAHTTAANFTRSMGMMTAELIGFGSAIAAAYTIKELGMAVFKTGQETLVADNAYKAITGSVAAAEKEMAFLRDTSASLGLNFYTLRDGYKGFLAAAQSSKIPMKEVQAIFRSISNASAVMGLSSEKTSLVFLALEQMMSKGKVSMEEIRRQMGDSLPGAFQIGARAMGMTVEAFDKAVSAGEVYSEDFLPKFRVAMEESFQGTIADSVKAINELAMAWEDAKNQMARGGFMTAIVDGMRELTVMLKDPSLTTNLTNFATGMGSIAKSSVWVAGGLGAVMKIVGDAGAQFGMAAGGALSWNEALTLGTSDIQLKMKELNGEILTSEEKVRLLELAYEKAGRAAMWVGDGAPMKARQEEIKKEIELVKQLAEANLIYESSSGIGSYRSPTASPVPTSPLTQALEAQRKAMSAAADKIEEDVMKRIAKTDDAKLTSYKEDLAAYQATGRDKKEIEDQLNADINKILDKRAKAAEKSLQEQIKAEKDAVDERNKIQEDFQSDYEKITMDSEEYDNLILQRKYDTYALHVEDKIKLEEWFAAESARLTDEIVNKELEVAEKYAKKVEDVDAKIQEELEKTAQETFDYKMDLLEKDFAEREKYATDEVSLERLKLQKIKALNDELSAASSPSSAPSSGGASTAQSTSSGGFANFTIYKYGGQEFRSMDAVNAYKDMISAQEEANESLKTLTENTAKANQLSAEAAQREIQQIIDEKKKAISGQGDRIIEWLMGKQRSEWGVAEWTNQFNTVSQYANGLDPTEEGFYENGLAALENMVDILMEIDALTEQQLSEQKALADTLLGSINTIDDAIISLQGGSLATVGSKEFFDKVYGEKMAAAVESPENVGDLVSFIEQNFLPFMKSYYADSEGYSTIFDNVLGGLEMLKGVYGTEWVTTVGGTKISYEWDDMVSFPLPLDPTNPLVKTIYTKDAMYQLPNDTNTENFITTYLKNEIIDVPLPSDVLTTYTEGQLFSVPGNTDVLTKYSEGQLFSVPLNTDVLTTYAESQLFNVPANTDVLTTYTEGQLFSVPGNNTVLTIYSKGQLFDVPINTGVLTTYTEGQLWSLPSVTDPLNLITKEEYNWIDMVQFLDPVEKKKIDWSSWVNFNFASLGNMVNSAFLGTTISGGDNAGGAPPTQLSDMVAGWNLTAVNKNITDMAETFANTKSVWKWIAEAGQWAVSLPDADDLGKSYAESKGFGFLEQLNSGDGIWVNSETTQDLDLGVSAGGNIENATNALYDFMTAIGLVPGYADLIIAKVKTGTPFQQAFDDVVTNLGNLETPLKDVGGAADIAKGDDTTGAMALYAALLNTESPFTDANTAINTLSGNVKSQLETVVGFFNSFSEGLGLTFAGSDLGGATAGKTIEAYEKEAAVTYSWIWQGKTIADMFGHTMDRWLKVNSLGQSVGGIVVSDGMPKYAGGGLTTGPSIAGEAGQEWIVPVYGSDKNESFLKSVGADPDAIGKAVAKYVGSGSGKEVNLTINLNVDGQVINTVVKKGLKGGDTDLIQAVRSVA